MPNTSPSPPPSSRPLMSFEATLPPNDYSSTPYKFFKVGHCKYGTSCQFLHPLPALSPIVPKLTAPIDIPNNVSVI